MDQQRGGEGPKEARSIIASTVGGVMTEEAGAVTGDLEVATRAGLGSVEVLVRYAGADEWYAVRWRGALSDWAAQAYGPRPRSGSCTSGS